MKRYASKLVLFVVGLTLAACQNGLSRVLEKSAQSDELRKETTVGAELPAGCPTITIPTGRTSIVVSYQEPTTDQKGRLLTELGYTTIYLNSPDAKTTAIRVWTNDAHGGARVTIRDVAVTAQEQGVCVTATNWARKESGPASLKQ